jgi:hypothetical protein
MDLLVQNPNSNIPIFQYSNTPLRTDASEVFLTSL